MTKKRLRNFSRYEHEMINSRELKKRFTSLSHQVILSSKQLICFFVSALFVTTQAHNLICHQKYFNAYLTGHPLYLYFTSPNQLPNAPLNASLSVATLKFIHNYFHALIHTNTYTSSLSFNCSAG